MRSYKLRINNKGKRWKKGESSASNPATTKFREQAKRKSILLNKKKNPAFTRENLIKHDEGYIGKKLPDKNADNFTIKTNLTTWTNCSNFTFNKILESSLINSQIHREILTILATVTEVVQNEGGTESDSEYLAILMTTLNSLNDRLSIIATSYLVNTVIKRVSPALLVFKFSSFCTILLKTLSEFDNGNSDDQNFQSCSLFYNSIFGSLSILLKSQSGVTLLESYTQKVFNVLLLHSLDERPRVRKCALKSILRIFIGPTQEPETSHVKSEVYPHQPLMINILEFVEAKANECTKKFVYTGSDNDYKCNKSLISMTNHILSLGKEVLCVVAKYHKLQNNDYNDNNKNGGSICVVSALIKKVFNLAFAMYNVPLVQNMTLKLTCLNVISQLFENSYIIEQSPESSDITLSSIFPLFDKEFNARILSALYELYPNNPKDSDDITTSKSTFRLFKTPDGKVLITLWIKCLIKGVISLTAKDSIIAKSHFARTLTISLHYLQTFGTNANIKDQISTLLCHSFSLILKQNTNYYRNQNESYEILSLKNLVDNAGQGISKLINIQNGGIGNSENKFIDDVVDYAFDLIAVYFETTSSYVKFAYPTSTSISMPFFSTRESADKFPSQIANPIKVLARLKDEIDNTDKNNSNLRSKIDKALIAAIKSYGPQRILNVIPLNVDPDGIHFDLSRSWLIPMFRDALRLPIITVEKDINTLDKLEIGWDTFTLFQTYFMPLISRLGEKASEHAINNNRDLSKKMKYLAGQIWTLLPSFSSCANKSDLKLDASTFFYNLIKTLPSDIEEINVIILKSLRNLILRNHNFGIIRYDINDAFFKSLIPALFNLYIRYSISTTNNHKLSTAETLKVCLSCCPKIYIQVFLQKLREKLRLAVTDEETCKIPSWLDIAFLLIPYLDVDPESNEKNTNIGNANTIENNGDIKQSLDFIYNYILDKILRNNNDETYYCIMRRDIILAKTIQKKAYKVLHALLSFPVSSRLINKTSLYHSLTLARSCTYPPSLPYRFSCFTSLISLNLHTTVTLLEAVRVVYGSQAAKRNALTYISTFLSFAVSPWNAAKKTDLDNDIFENVGDFLKRTLVRPLQTFMSEKNDKNSEADKNNMFVDMEGDEDICENDDCEWETNSEGDVEIEQAETSEIQSMDSIATSNINIFAIKNAQEAVARIITLSYFYNKSDNFEESHMRLSERMKCDILNAVISFLSSSHKLIVKHSLEFLYTCIKHTPKSLILKYSGIIVSNYSKIPKNFKRVFHFKLKLIMVKLLKKTDSALLATFVPLEFKPTFEKIRKMEKRRAHKLAEVPKVNGILKKSNSHINAEIDELSYDQPRQKTRNCLSIEENMIGDKIFDLLDPDDAENYIVHRNHKKLNEISSLPKEATKEFPVSKDGRMIIGLKDINKKNKDISQSCKSPNEDESDIEKIDESDMVASKRNMKRIKFTSNSLHSNSNNFSKNKRIKIQQNKKNDLKMQPYSYLPLDRNCLNRRKQAKSETKLKGIVGSAKKGALAGKKCKNRKLKF
ncbi:unnamed protein product [Gordionus sp. m RMFG-2023]|uniref:RRP12-like protein isoform X2 n=1 Tax=Gordionus sp. m RMFG-2023 TaxID=3053472 RepID=UPI0030E49D35